MSKDVKKTNIQRDRLIVHLGEFNTTRKGFSLEHFINQHPFQSGVEVIYVNKKTNQQENNILKGKEKPQTLYHITIQQLDVFVDRILLEFYKNAPSAHFFGLINRRLLASSNPLISLAFSPCGHLILSVNETLYQRLGVHGQRTFINGAHHKSRNPSAFRFNICVNLKDSHLLKGKGIYSRLMAALKRVSQAAGSIELMCRTDDNIQQLEACLQAQEMNNPFKKTSKAFQVKKHPPIEHIKAPHIPSNSACKAFHIDELAMYAHSLMQWIGLVEHGFRLHITHQDTSSSSDVLTGPLDLSIPMIEKKNMQLHRTSLEGFILPSEVLTIVQNVQEEIQQEKYTQSSLGFVVIHVQGTPNAPISWQHNEHGSEGLHDFCIVFPNNNASFYQLFICLHKHDQYLTGLK
mmetsp:Transcript_4076/g.6107  ORF Transcript_4076/g.6107 Transcript_4076/m.6107 type:complete len:405 (+) Transcript_4076:74-1288(+)